MILIGAAAPAGLFTGLLAWVLAGGLSVQATTLDGVEARLAALKSPEMAAGRGGRGGDAALLSSPLFALTTGPGAIREPAIRVDGISVSRGRQAALISLDGKAAEWLVVGESREGVTLQAVSGSAVTVETAVGTKTLSIGDQSAASSPAPDAPAPVAAASLDQAPAGLRLPPEPASAPRTP